MNGASKILTVSYGTFSCTLEGFDDPFNTMKAIAEYFRDLAAEDRYFGAEPPTPDAAMLHRIAEREIQRRVEAKIQENGVVLRASEDAPVPAVPAVAPVAVAPAVAPAVAQAEPVAAAPVAPSVAPAAAPAAESVVEKLSRLRNEVAAQPASAAPVATVPFVSFAIPDYLEDHEALDAAPVADIPAAEFLPESEAPAAIEAGEAPLPEDMPAAAVADEEPVAEAAPVADLVADLLPETAEAEVAFEPVAEVLAEVDAAPAAVDAPVEAVAEAAAVELPESLMAALADPLVGAPVDEVPVATVAEIAAPVADDATAEPFAALDESEDALLAETLAAALADADDLGAAEVAAAAEGAEEDALLAETLAAFDMADADPARPGETAADAEDEEEDDLPRPAGRNEGIAALFGTDILDAPDAAPEAAAPLAPELRPAAAEKLQRARARVIRIRRGEEAAVDAPTPAAPAARAEEADLSSVFAEVETPASVAPVAARPVAAPEPRMAEEARALLSAEDEAELQRELAALRSLTDSSDEDTEEDADDADEDQPEARRAFATGPSADEAMGRLMEQTDTEMQGPETKRRQSAIAHLKAAVAATVADRKVTGEPTEEKAVSRLARYRNDLAMVVKSALPGAKAEEGKPAERPAPLVLVSEQRIDRPRPAPVAAPPAPAAAVSSPAPVRPRRVSSSGLAMQEAFYEEEGEEDVANLFGETKGFAEFVDRIGATTLEEILEASAAYMSAIEGREHFSRPQLMWHVNAVVPQGTYQREDGLRGFGTLLRNGRIAKLRRGAFVLSEDSPYLAEAKKIAG